MFMISVLPQTEHLHRNANGLTAKTQLQLVAGWFVGSALLVGPALLITIKQASSSSIVHSGWGATRGHCCTPNCLAWTGGQGTEP